MRQGRQNDLANLVTVHYLNVNRRKTARVVKIEDLFTDGRFKKKSNNINEFTDEDWEQYKRIFG